MATVNKDFKIKSGLIVEGTTATVNGHDILTKKPADDQYIIDLIGGSATSANTPDTVVLRDGSGNFAAQDVTVNTLYVGGSTNNGIDVVDGDTELGSNNGIVLSAQDDITLNTSGGDVVLNPDGNSFLWSKSSANQISTQGYVDGEISSLDTAAQGYATAAENNAKGYADSLAPNYDAAGSASSAQSAAQLYADGVAGDAYTNAVADAASDATTKANNALSDANDYTDTAISTEVTNRNDAIATAKSEAISAAEDYTDTAVGNIVGAAPELLDTLQELAAALENNPDIIADLQDVAAGKQDTLTAGNNIDITGATISVTGLDTDDVSEGTNLYFTNQRALSATSAAYDIAGAADTAYNNAVSDAAFDATSKANTAQTNATNYTDQEISSEVTNRNNAITSAIDALTTSDIEEGSNLYFTDYAAKVSAVDLLTNATKENIEITWTNQGGLVIAAENGVADSTTDDLEEGETNLYFTDSRALDAVSGSNIQPESIDITWVRRENATWTNVPTASQVVCHQAGGGEGSMKYLVRVTANVGGTQHSHVTELLATVDGSHGVAVVEYGTIYTSENPMATATVLWNGLTNCYELNVTTANNNSEVMVAATMLAYQD